MPSRIEMLAELRQRGIEVSDDTHQATLAKMLKDTENEINLGENLNTPQTTEEAMTEIKNSLPSVENNTKEKMVPISQVEQMIHNILASRDQESKAPKKLKKTTEHFANVHRFDGKWVVGFVDQNTDPYVKSEIHAFDKFDEKIRQNISHIELKFLDGTTKVVPLLRYLDSRVTVKCPIINRKKEDISYSFGSVEIKKEDPKRDRLVGTGVVIEQEVEMYRNIFTVITPEKEELELPSYVLA